MKTTNPDSKSIAKLPEGYFCGGNCADCVYYEPRNKDSNGRGYCNYYSTYYYPSERNGCFNYKEY